MQPPANAQGPFVAMAVLCERVEPREDGSVTVHGIVDGIGLTPEPREDDPLGLQPVAALALTALVSLRAGHERGVHELGLQGVFPSGDVGPSASRAIEFSDDLPGASLVVPVQFEIHEPGLYHFDVRYDGRLLTRIPLLVAYH